MEFKNIAVERLYSQKMRSESYRTPETVVSWMGVVQAQDYPGAKWSIGLRLSNKTDKYIEKALKSKQIVRTWANRGTLHFVHAEDIKWLLNLLSQRFIKVNARRYRELGLDDKILLRSETILKDALEGTKGIKRSDLRSILEESGVSTEGQRFTFILQRASLDGYIHQGIAIKNDPVYYSMDDLPSSQLNHDEALKEISKRYFNSHGPATLKDFVWWSGLRVKDATKGLTSIKSQLYKFEIANKTYWSGRESIKSGDTEEGSPIVHILPIYDDYLLGYKDRGASIDDATKKLLKPQYGRFSQVIIVNGIVTGTWKREILGDKVSFKLNHYRKLTNSENEALISEIFKYAKFIDKECGDIETNFGV